MLPDIIAFTLIALGALLFVLSVWQVRRRRKFLTQVLFALLGNLAIIILLGGNITHWYFHRPQPADTHRQLYPGIVYTRDVRQEPRPQVIHVVTIDLTTPGIRFFATPGEVDGDQPFIAQTTSQFLEKYNLQLAINADAFAPWWSNLPFDYYPHVGDTVDTRGLSASQGKIYSTGYHGDVAPTIYFSEANKITIDEPEGEIYHAVSGLSWLVQDGVYHQIDWPDNYYTTLHPRTVYALDESGETFIIIVVDGRQPNYSEGVLIEELAAITIAYGGYNAINMDGGGSSTLITANSDGSVQKLNSPIQGRIPGYERPIANHLGVYALP